jgi:hypothetical protein
MKATQAEEQALIALLNRIYGDIRTIELEWRILVDANDYRPRIEYFHDAIRMLTSGQHRSPSGKGRLSVEFLAYDISMLRHIQANPLVKSKTKGQSPKTQVQKDPMLHAAHIPIDSGVKLKLADLYKNYAVLFAALLADTADRNYQSRVGEHNEEVEGLAQVTQAALAMKSDTPIDIENLIDMHIDDLTLMSKILFRLRSGKSRRSLPPKEAAKHLKDAIAEVDKEIKSIEKAHFTYVTAQLAVYEGARDVVKGMAVKGLNIVGGFVENAVRDAMRGGKER